MIAIGGTPNAAKVGDKGIDGRIYPVSAIPPKDGKMREDRSKGFFVLFDYTMDAEKEIRAFFLRTGKEIVSVKVSQILAGDIPIRLN